MSHARFNAKLQQQSADSAAARQLDAVTFARALLASTDAAASAASVENELRVAYPDLDAAAVHAIARDTPLLRSPPRAQAKALVSPPSPIVVHVPSRSSSNTAVLSDFASTPQKRSRRAAAPTDLSESAKRARTSHVRSHSAAKARGPVTTPTKTSAVGASEDGARMRALRSPQAPAKKSADASSRHRDGAVAAWVPTKASLVVCADDEFSTRWTDGLPGQHECWCSKAFADAAAFQAHKCDCDVGLRGFLTDSVLAFADSAQKTLHERLETVSHGYIRRFHWGVPRTPSADADAAVQRHLARQYHLMVRHTDALLFAMHPDAEEFAIRHTHPLAAKAKPTAAAARKAAAAAAAVENGDHADDAQELGKSSAFLLATDLLLIGAMIRSNVITTSLQMRFMLANLVASVRFTFGPESRRYELVRKIVDHVDLSLVQQAEAARGREWSERLFAVADDEDRARASAPVAAAAAAAAAAALDGDDGELVLDGEIPPLGSNAPIAFGALRDVRRLKPIVDGPVDPADSRALKALLRELRPAQLLGQRRLRDVLSEELARQPARPHASAPLDEWRLYAQGLERVNAAYAARLDDIDDAVADVNDVLQDSERERRFAWMQADAKTAPDAVQPSQRLHARMTNYGTYQAVEGVPSLPSVILAGIDDDGAGSLELALSGGDGVDARADAELMMLCEELVGVPFVSVAELRFYAFLRRELSVQQCVYVGDMRQWLATRQMTPAQLAEVKKICDHAALMQDQERAAAKSNSLTVPLAPSEAECAPLTWNTALHFLRSLIQYGVLRVATADSEAIELVDDSDARRVAGERSIAPGQLRQRTRPTAREWKIVFDLLREMSITADDVRTFRAYKPRSEEVYGEAHPIFCNQLIRHMAITSDDVFVDIGSGIGTVVMQVALMCGCRAMGIEIRTALHRVAETFLAQLKEFSARRGWTGMGEVLLLSGDATALPELEVANDHGVKLRDATVVFCNNYVFSVELEDKIFNMLDQCLKPGAKVVVMKPYCPRYRPGSQRWSGHVLNNFKYPYEVASTARESVSWTSNAVSYFIYTYAPRLSDHLESGPPPPKPEFTQLNAPR
jgi:precorrin-6B methylase 2